MLKRRWYRCAEFLGFLRFQGQSAPKVPLRFKPCLEGMEERITPADFTVTNLAGAGAGSLSRAISDLNTLGGAQNNINFNANLQGEISQTIGFETITKNVSINGTGADRITVQRSFAAGTGNFRIFTVRGNVTATIKGLTIKNGRETIGTGGAILNFGNLTLKMCKVTLYARFCY